MGCWNETCVCTNLPIIYGDPCEAVVLLETPYRSEGYYPTTNYIPIAIVHGAYNDYGGLDNIEQEETIMKFLRRLPSLSVKNSEGILKPATPNTFGEFIELSDDGLCIIPKDDSVPETAKRVLEVRVVFLKSEVLDLIDTNEDVRCELFDNYIHALKKAKSDLIPYTITDPDREKMDAFNRKFMFNSTIRDVWRMLSDLYIKYAARDFFAMLWKEDEELAETITRKLMRAKFVMSDLRKAWHIPSGKGSQRSVDSVHEAFLELYREEVFRLKHEG